MIDLSPQISDRRLCDRQDQTTIDLSTFNQRADHRRIRDALRRQCGLNGKRATAAGTDRSPTFGYETTVGDIARAVNLPPQTVVAHLTDAWLVILDRDESKPIESWGVSEDGE